MEEWKQIIDYPNYDISNLGNVKNKITNIILKGNKRMDYKIVHLWKSFNDKSIKNTFYIHRLVAIHFIPNLENKPRIDHIDRNKLNNNMNNLRWVTVSQNAMNTKIPINNITGIKGVSYYNKKNKYVAELLINKKKIRKAFDIIEEAKQQRELWEIKYFGEYRSQ